MLMHSTHGGQSISGVSSVDRDGNNALQIKARGVVIATCETRPEEGQTPPGGAAMPEDHSCVFVVDDDQPTRESLSNLLRSMGLNVQTCASAHEFLTRPRPAVPSCLVLDVQLPGLSGLDLQQELAKSHAPMPIIFLTGHGDIPMTVRAMKAGAIDFLTKPFRDQDLLTAV